MSLWFCQCMVSFQGVAAKKQPAQLTHSHTHPDLSTPPSAGVRQQRKCFLWLHLAAGTLGTSPRTLIQTYRKALLSTAAQAGFIVRFLIHKAAACKWGKTSPKSWRSKEAPAQQLQRVSAGTVGRSLCVVSADLTGKYAENDQCCLFCVSPGEKSVYMLLNVVL